MDEHLDRNFLEVELHEKIVVRERRKKALIIGISAVLFLFFCGIPVYNEQLPKWEGLEAARKLGVEIEKLKTESIRLKKPLFMKIQANGTLEVIKVSECSAKAEENDQSVEKIYSRNWHDSPDKLSILDPLEAKKRKLGLVIDAFCFDPVTGLAQSSSKKVIVILPVKDLAEIRMDRASYVEIVSSNANISIN